MCSIIYAADDCYEQQYDCAGYTVDCVRTFPGSHSFKSAWVEIRYIYYNDVYVGVIEYGYDTAFINEDYSHFNADFYSHNASVSNDKGMYTSGDKMKTVWASKEIRHVGDGGQYYIGTLKGFEKDVYRFDFDAVTKKK